MPRRAYSGPVKETIYIRCPLCGLHATENKRESRKGVITGFRGGPYRPMARLQRIGGSEPSPTRKMKDRPGNMEWTNPEQITEEQAEMIARKINGIIHILEEMNGRK